MICRLQPECGSERSSLANGLKARRLKMQVGRDDGLWGRILGTPRRGVSHCQIRTVFGASSRSMSSRSRTAVGSSCRAPHPSRRHRQVEPVRISEAGVGDMKRRFDAALAFEQRGRLREVEPLRRRIEPAQASASGGEGYFALAMGMSALARTPALPEVMLARSLSAQADIGSD
jgi:hypothetical protein